MALGAAAALALAAAPAAAAPVLWAGNNHYYEYVGTGVTFEGALAAAEAAVFTGYEGYLATITSAEENAFVASLVLAGAGRYTQTWVGGSDRETEGVWKWITGPEIGTVFYNGGAIPGQYSNFPAGEPNNNGPENGLSAFYFGDLRWNDLSTGAANGYVVEYRLAPSGGVPEPATWAMMILGFGLAGTMVRRRRLAPAA
jgi:hypothetical protein